MHGLAATAMTVAQMATTVLAIWPQRHRIPSAGALAIWRSGDLAIWRSGDLASRTVLASSNRQRPAARTTIRLCASACTDLPPIAAGDCASVGLSRSGGASVDLLVARVPLQERSSTAE